MQMAWLEACVGIDPNPNAKRFSNVPEDCGATLIQRARVFSSACPFAGLQEWLRAGFEAKHFAFLPSAEVASGDAVRAREVALELAELMGAGVRSSGLGSGAPLDDGLSAEAFAVHANSSYGLRGEVLYGASCVSGGAARVRQEEDMAAEVQRSVAEGRQREPPVEPRRQSGLGFGPELRRRLGDLYDGHCAAPLAAWLGVDMDRLYGRVLPELTPEQRGVEL
uniref:Uncharacterized protein n=1 Tax=Phaeomonas parva TaxID=124430 RepID=A0A7S1TV62_9STRA|mmetsp:Transcript_18473/g.56453  ORF Transcript_18473/g.56453 Transcript_18473/m.56453 type:complete len:223 (+) Transcript_18473:254-922(+)